MFLFCGTYQFRASDPSRGTFSNPVTVTFGTAASGPFVESSNTAGRALTVSATESGYVGTFTIMSTVAQGGQLLSLEELEGGVWVSLLGWGSDGTGKAVMAWGGPGGTYQFEATVTADQYGPAATSPVISVTYP